MFYVLWGFTLEKYQILSWGNWPVVYRQKVKYWAIWLLILCRDLQCQRESLSGFPDITPNPRGSLSVFGDFTRFSVSKYFEVDLLYRTPAVSLGTGIIITMFCSSPANPIQCVPFVMNDMRSNVFIQLWIFILKKNKLKSPLCFSILEGKLLWHNGLGKGKNLTPKIL